MTTTVDSHQHYWDLQRFHYDWISPGNAALHKNRLPDDLRPQMLATQIDHAILVHATNTAEEIPWLLSLCDDAPYIRGVVGFIDLSSRTAGSAIEGFVRNRRFKGVRLHLPFAPRDRLLIDASLLTLARHNLSCDLLLNANSLTLAAQLAQAHPDTLFVLDHMAGAHLTPGGEIDYAMSIKPFTNLTNTVMKVSGYLTASGDLPLQALGNVMRPYLDIALNVFGPDRLMYGSDWSVCTQRGSYADTVQTLRALTRALSANDQTLLWGGTATRVYRL